MKRALISVFNKTGVVDFASGLVDLGFEIISTGGTARHLSSAGVPVISVESVTQFPEMLDGRVKTLHPRIHAGILAQRDKTEHMQTLSENNIEPIDVVCVNLYPFSETINRPGVSRTEAIEQIDIGGPTALRAVAKNAKDVWAVADPSEYSAVLSGIKSEDATLRSQLAAKVFSITAAYDAAIAHYLNPEPFPEKLTMTYQKRQALRYGENAHQQAAFYTKEYPSKISLASANQLHGKELSYNNIKDADAALSALSEFDRPAVVAVKHMNPCGIGLGDDIEQAWDKAYSADKMSIFGGIVALNRSVDLTTATKMHALFLEIIMAPAFDDDAYAILAKKKNVRLLTIGLGKAQPGELEAISVTGGLLLQNKDRQTEAITDMTVVTEIQPTEAELKALQFAQTVVKHVKSNAIVVATADQTLGIGCGQMNRIGSVELAISAAKKQPRFNEAVLASDAFFPMDDCVEYSAKHGIHAIIQPGGSIRDQDSIDKANELGIVMVTTGVRHFRH